MKVAVVGSGYVGTVAGVCLAELGHEVFVIDCDANRIESLRLGRVPFYEQSLPELIQKHIGKRLHFITNLAEGVQGSSAIFIAVGTPSLQNGEADLSAVEAAVREVAKSIRSYTVVIEKSTVPVMTAKAIRNVMMLNGAPESMFDVVSNPEFLREGTAINDFLYPDRIVVGSSSEAATNLLTKIYAPLIDGSYYARADRMLPIAEGAGLPEFIVTDPMSAELIKHASNSFLAMKISYANVIANLCETVGADVEKVCRGIGGDSRIGRKFLRPGIGYGGSCFPKDVAAFSSVARELGHEFGLLDQVAAINADQRVRFVRKIKRAIWTLRGKKIAVLGLAYKGGTDDVRESPALAIVNLLLDEGCEIVAYDPAAMQNAAREISSDRMKLVSSAYDAAAGCDAMVILTDWQQFAQLNLVQIREQLKYPIVIDGRNLYDPREMEQAGLIYHSVGRSEPPMNEVTKLGATGS
jgi:UDPglucose 6-dehydrogenase